MSDFHSEIQRRRTFAIISHPDAGKTTITERILFHGGVIREIGDVKGKQGTKAATSDWMKMEQERGVSITSSAMQFDYEGLRVNLLDTPGHKDFSEDTYRTLIAADCAAMLIDAAKGVETQTRKLYEVCRLRKLPIFTFANKVDREGKSPLDVIDDVQNTLQMNCYPVTWPVGMGGLFRGIYHRLEKRLYLFTKGDSKARIVDVSSFDDPVLLAEVGEDLYKATREELELLEGVLGDFDQAKFLKGELSPMTFGSAKQDWGVDLFLDLFTAHAPPPQPRGSREGTVDPQGADFTGFVFKIQANMDRKHRDRVAFIRVCSGKFTRGMKVRHMRLGREIRLAYANQLLAQERETVEVAYSGDIVGITDTGNFQIGDSVSEGREIHFDNIPRFSPEHFGRITVKDALKRKQMEKGLRQLVDEGSIQMFCDPGIGWQDPILGVVGVMQFEVLVYRLNDEYNLEVKLETLPYSRARWPSTTENLKGNLPIFEDAYGRKVILFKGDWELNYAQRENPTVDFRIIGA